MLSENSKKSQEKQCDFEADLHVENCFFGRQEHFCWTLRVKWGSAKPERVWPSPDRIRQGPDRVWPYRRLDVFCPAAGGSEKTCKITILLPKCARGFEKTRKISNPLLLQAARRCAWRERVRGFWTWGLSSVRRYENFGTVHRRTLSGPSCSQ